MKLLLGFVATSVAWYAIAGSVISWDAEKTSGSWSDGANWVGGVAPTEGDAVLFTIGASAVLSVDIDQPVSVSNIWVNGGGRVTLKEAGATQVLVTGNLNAGAEVNKVLANVGSGRQSVLVTGGSTLVVDGISVTNNQTTTYHDLQMNQASALIITNGAEFVMPVRLPATGSGAVNNDTFTVLVTGEGSKFAKTGGSTQISGNGGRIYCENGGHIDGQIAWSNNPKDLVYSFKNGSFFFDGTLSLGTDGKIILDEGSTGRSSSGLNLNSVYNSQFIIRNGSTYETTSLCWGHENSTNNVCLVTNATLTVTGDMTLGARKAMNTNHPKSNTIVIAKDGLFDCSTASKKFDVGFSSDNDLLFIDGGTMTDARVTHIGYQDCLNTVFKIRGETASVSFTNTLTFDNAATLACELPLPTDRAVMTSTSTVTINPGTKFAVTLPEGFAPGTYTILTANSIIGTIEDADISVTGKGTCRLVQDGTSIKMTVKPESGLNVIVR